MEATDFQIFFLYSYLCKQSKRHYNLPKPSEKKGNGVAARFILFLMWNTYGIKEDTGC